MSPLENPWCSWVPLDPFAPETFEAWCASGDGRTLDEFAATTYRMEVKS